MNDIAAAIAGDRIEAYLQPLVPIGSRPPGLFEALARMRDAHGNILEPLAFLEDAVRTQTVTLLDLWMVDLIARGGPYPPGTRILVNLSDESFHSQATLSAIEERILRQPSLGDILGFELRGQTLPEDAVRMAQPLKRLSDLGCPFALDDYGIECPRPEQLELPVEYIKLAGRIVQDADIHPGHLSVIRATAAACGGLGKTTIAEWVERQVVLEQLREVGVDYAQGFLLARPQPISLAIGRR